MSLGGFLVAAGLGAAAVKISERVKAANPDSKPGADEYVKEAKAFASELTDKAKDYAPVAAEKAKETVQKVKDNLNL